MAELGIRVKYMHSDIDTMERAEIIRDRDWMSLMFWLASICSVRDWISGDHACGVLDADKEGFLRSNVL